MPLTLVERWFVISPLPPLFFLVGHHCKFLGFSTEGLEKDILEFLVKIRKRRERVHSKTLLEKSKFERELKRLECSINYEEGRKQKGTMQGRGCQILVVQ